MKNIAVVITKLDLGGAQKVVLYLAKNLDRKKFSVHLLAGPGGMLDGEAVSIKDIRLSFIKELKHPVSPINDIKSLNIMKKYFIENKIDTVHTHSSKAGFLGRLAASSAGVKNIIHTVHGFPFHEYQNPALRAFYIILERYAALKTDILAAVGADVKEYGLKNKVGAAGKYRVIRAGIDIGLYRDAAKDREEVLSGAGLAPSVYTVGMIGNLKKQKNPFEFIETAQKTLSSDPGVQFIFAGGGSEKQEQAVRKKLKKLKIEDKVKFTGWIKNPVVFMKSIDLFLLTSRWEGLPCTLVQAAAAGIPRVASDIAGNREIIKLAGRGELYAPGNTGEAAAKILVFKKMNSCGGKIFSKPEQVPAEFDLINMLHKYAELY